MVALVGASGSGKSTIAHLVSRLYDPTEGMKRCSDDLDLREVLPSSLRQHVGVVSQEPLLFATSIAENIRYGNMDASEDDIREAASKPQMRCHLLSGFLKVLIRWWENVVFNCLEGKSNALRLPGLCLRIQPF